MRVTRLSLAELKAKAGQVNVVENIESIKGGSMADCHKHSGDLIPKTKPGDVRTQ